MSWINVDDKRTLIEKLCINILKCGPIPKHLAVIMDGNRRYANKCFEKVITGHMHGFNKLTQLLSWCNDLGITEVTVYAFSIENFKRSEEEVDSLMDLAREKFAKLIKEKDEFNKRGVCFRIFGAISLLPLDLQKSIAEVVLLTKNNSKAFLNIAFAYTSHEEMTNAIQEISDGVKDGHLLQSDINESLFEKCLYTTNVTDPDLLIRTSGEMRLSDFLLWQSGFSVLAFVNVLWPEFTIWDLFSAVFYYQRHYSNVIKAKQNYYKEQRLAEELTLQREFQLSQQTDFNKFKTEHDKRIKKFTDYLVNKRTNMLVNILNK